MATPVKFEGHNCVAAENQPEYLPLPLHVDTLQPEGPAVSCWELTPEELEEVKKTGRVYVEQLTFNRGITPLRVSAVFPLPE